jgi:regulatory protein spx
LIRLYELPSNASSRNAKAKLTEFGLPFTIHNMHHDRLTLEELSEILSYAEDGVTDILANGKVRKKLEEEGVNFEEIPMSQFHQYVKMYPTLIKAPIVIRGDLMLVGYNEEEYRVLQPRAARLQMYAKQLEAARAYEDKRLKEGKVIAGGHWG